MGENPIHWLFILGGKFTAVRADVAAVAGHARLFEQGTVLMARAVTDTMVAGLGHVQPPLRGSILDIRVGTPLSP